MRKCEVYFPEIVPGETLVRRLKSGYINFSFYSTDTSFKHSAWVNKNDVFRIHEILPHKEYVKKYDLLKTAADVSSYFKDIQEDEKEDGLRYLVILEAHGEIGWKIPITLQEIIDVNEWELYPEPLAGEICTPTKRYVEEVKEYQLKDMTSDHPQFELWNKLVTPKIWFVYLGEYTHARGHGTFLEAKTGSNPVILTMGHPDDFEPRVTECTFF